MTRKFLSCFVIALLACIALPGCSSAREKAASKQIAVFNDLADRLAKIKTTADLTAAKPDLEAIGARMKDLDSETKQLPAPTADEQSSLDSKFKSDQDKAFTRVKDELERITTINPMAIAEVLTDLKFDPTTFAK